MLAAAATIVDKRESLRWLWALLVLIGALAGAVGAVLASTWWQTRQEMKQRHAEIAAERLRQRVRDVRDHFEPRGRGVLPFAGRRGWYFTGRVQVLRELAGWLAGPPTSQSALRVVTGDPGSGKSAVLGRLVLLADPAPRQEALRVDPDLDPATLAPEMSIALSMHVHGWTLQQVVDAVAATVGVEVGTVEDLLAELERLAQPVTVVVDAVDEAAGAEELAAVLVSMAKTGGVRLLVGVRRHLVDRLVTPDQAIDLDAPAYLARGDVVAYVRRCLLLDADPEAPTPYRGQPDLAGRIAEAVAARAGRSFLVSQLVSLALVNAGQVVDVSEPGWRERFPREVGEAMRAYLDGFRLERSRVRDLLMPLAFAEGEGLADRELWAALAGALGTAVFMVQDVEWLLRDTSASNLLQRTQLDDGTVAWRLFHQALAEYLRDGEALSEPKEAQSRITQVLVERVPIRDGRKDWVAANAYIRSHLPTHAAAAGRLDEFVVDPGVLLVAEPSRLMPVLPRVTNPDGRAAARAYQQAAHQLTDDRPLGQRASCLQRAARYCSATDLAERILKLGIELPWVTRWAHWQTSGTFRQLTGHASTVEAVALLKIDDEPVIVSGSHDGTVRIWDARSGQPRGQPITGHTRAVVAVAVGQVDGEPVIISGSDDNTVRIWDARSGQPRREPLTGHTAGLGLPNGVRVTLMEIDDEPVIVSAGDDDTVRLWNARSGKLRLEPLTGLTGGAVAVASGQIDGDPVIICGDGDGAVWIWDARSGQPRGQPLTGHTRAVVAMAVGQVDGETTIVSSSDDDTVRIWDARSGKPRGKLRTGQSQGIWAVALGEIDDESVIVSGSSDGAVRIWDPRSGQPSGQPLSGHTSGVEGIALGEIDGEPVIITGGEDDTVRIWDARSGQPRREPLTGHTGGIIGVASGQIDDQPVIITGGEDDTVRIWDARSGQPRGEPLTGHTKPVWVVASGQIGDEPIIVSGSEDATVRMWNARSGQPRGKPLTGHTGGVEGLALGTIDNETVIVSGSEDGTVRMWNARSGQPRGKPLLGHGRLVRAVAIGHIDHRQVIVSSGGENGTIRMWDARSGQPQRKPMPVHARLQSTGVRVVLTQVDGEPVIVSADGDGTLRTWDARSGRPRGGPSIGHSRPVWALAVGKVAGELAIISGSDDKTVRVWDMQLRQRCCIEVDAEPGRVACTPDGLIVVGTGLGLAAFEVAAPVDS
jgi:WD40 repeat protein